MWLDGVCKKCGSLVIETGCEMITEEEFRNDYKNMCLNDECEEHKWHYVGDQEELDYYVHNPSISKKIKIENI